LKHLLLLGGGHSHIEVLRQFSQMKPAGVAVTLVDPARHAIYSGMLPGVIAGRYAIADCSIDLARLANAAGAHTHFAAATTIDPRRRKVTLDNGGSLDYDLLSIDIGSVPAASTLAGVSEFALATRPADAFIAACDGLAAQAGAGMIKRVVVVGGGAAGIEIALALVQRLRRASVRSAAFALVTEQSHLLKDRHPRAQRLAARALCTHGIELHLKCRVLSVEASGVVTTAGRIETSATIWATGPAAPAWLAGSGLALDTHGFVEVDSHLQSTSHADVFAAGDCTTLRGEAHPKSGVYAVRQGPVLAENLRQSLAKGGLRAFNPQSRALALLATGDGRAIGAYGPLAFAGQWVWRWKDHIDRSFVARYRV
jgi:selenide,water dikinase